MKMMVLVLSVSSEEGGSCDVPVLKDIQAVDVKYKLIAMTSKFS